MGVMVKNKVARFFMDHGVDTRNRARAATHQRTANVCSTDPANDCAGLTMFYAVEPPTNRFVDSTRIHDGLIQSDCASAGIRFDSLEDAISSNKKAFRQLTRE